MYPGCMLASEWSEWPAELDRLVVEPKLDGYRLSAVVDGEGNVSFHCRGAAPATWGENLQHIADEIKSLGFRNCMLDGEVVGEDWNETASLVRRKRSLMDEATKARIVEKIKYHVFDLVPLGRFEEVKPSSRRKPVKVFMCSLKERREKLMRTLCIGLVDLRFLRLVPQYEVGSDESLQDLFQEFLDLGYEGAMVKNPEAWYYLDRSEHWMKLKSKKPLDLKIVGYVEGLGKHVGRLGAFVCVDAKGTEIKVGGGFTDAQREEFWAHRESLLGCAIEAVAQADDVATARFPVFTRLRDETPAGSPGR